MESAVRSASPGCDEKGHDGGDGVLRCQLHGGVVPAAKKVHTKKIQAAFFQKKKEAERAKKQIAEDELVSHGYSFRGGGLTASRGGKYVATFDQQKPTQITATSVCPHVAALVFNLFAGGEPTHKLKFAELAELGLGRGQLEQQAAALVDAARVKSDRKRLVKG
jgi:hypothetical protein